MTDEKKLRTDLGDDLWKLTRQVGSPLKSATLLTTLRSEQFARASFKLEFEDRTVLKGRRLESNEHAEKIELLSGLLDRTHFPEVKARHRKALLIEWREGRPVTSDRATPSMTTRCGEILGAMHTIDPPNELRSRYECTAARWQVRFRVNLEELERRRALTKEEVNLALELAMKAPDDAATGLMHGDLCPENLVETSRGQVAFIDNETLSIDVLAYDLARTWSRWPMDMKHAQALYAGYHRHRESNDFRKNRRYWAVAVLSEAALFRLQGDIENADLPLHRLKSLLGRGSLDDVSCL